MHYKEHTVIGVRKTRYDMLWHVLYVIGGKTPRETYDRVSQEEAMEALKLIGK
jgi:hypothetical protein